MSIENLVSINYLSQTLVFKVEPNFFCYLQVRTELAVIYSNPNKNLILLLIGKD